MTLHTMDQCSPEWFQLRIGKVTGSRLKDLMKSDNLPLLDKVLAEILTGQSLDEDSYTSYAMERGKELEPEAIKQYEAVQNVTVERIGFMQSDRWPLLGMSPDGIVSDEGGVETKCEGSNKHVSYLRQGQLPAVHKWQVFAPFLISEKIQWWDFVSYDPRVEAKPLFIFRTERKDIEAELSIAEKELDKFFAKLEKYKAKILF